MSEFENNSDAMQLVSAEPESEEYAPILRVLLAAAYMGAFSGFMALLAALLPLVSGKPVKESIPLSIAAILFFSLCAFVLSMIDNRKKRAFEKEQKELIDSAKKFDGEIVSCDKITSTVNYGKAFEQTVYVFNAEYKDETGDVQKAVSGKYMNDISHVLTDKKITVMKLADGSTRLCGFHTAQSGDECIELPINERDEV
ncbi:MAG: hypothetical protein IIZ59_03285 [Clostridia bacterium]|nr:hypothetical protein [Clostridia bacterium]